MRKRLVGAFVGLTVLVVAAYGIPRAYLLADLVRTDEQARVDRTAEVLARLLDERLADGRVPIPAELDALAAPGERLSVSGLPSGGTVTGSGAGAAVDVSASRPLEGGGLVTVSRTQDAIRSEITRAVLPLVLLGLLLAGLAALSGLLLARRLSRPFAELAHVARGLGEGQLHPVPREYDVPEARAIERALVDTGARVDGLLQQERQVAVHASHELRTPVTALRLELEDLALWPQTPPPLAAELQRCVGELDRLSEAITRLLDLSARHRATAEVGLDLDALAATVARAATSGALTVVHEASRPTPTRLDPVTVRQVLSLLLDEARDAGAGRAVLRVTARDGHDEVSVTCEQVTQPRPRGLDAATRWSRARDLAAGAGGHLTRTEDAMVLRLPRRVPPGGDDPAH